MEIKKLYVLSFCAVKKEDLDSNSVHEDYENLCLSSDKQFLLSLVDCLEKVDKFRDLITSSSSSSQVSGLPLFEYRYRISDFPLHLVL